MHTAYAVGSVLLILGTWLLWTPQHVFPRVPLFAQLADLPPAIASPVTWSLLISWLCVTGALACARSRLLAWGYAIIFVCLIALDQHRLQPWGVHIALGLLLLNSLELATARRWIIYLTASIYIYSALSKLDAQFLHTVGQDFLRSLLALLGMPKVEISETVRLALALVFPVGELVCGLGLLARRTRATSLVMAIIMHGVLLLILSPWGLNHSWGVLLWNGVFVAQNVWLIRSSRLERAGVPDPAGPSAVPPIRTDSVAVKLVCVIVFVLPVGERLGLVDHWLGWALYAPHSSRATIEVTESGVEREWRQLDKYFGKANELNYRRLRTDQWSLDVLGVPMYPQQRMYVGVARSLATKLEEFEVRVLLQSTSNRFTGRRQVEQLENRQDLEAASGRYWFGTRAAK